MYSFRQTYYVAILCGIVLLGKFPVVLHMAACKHDECCSHSAVLIEHDHGSDHHHGHSHSHAQHSVDSDAIFALQSGSNLPAGEHDAEGCTLCQSFYTLTAVADDASHAVLHETVISAVFEIDTLFFTASDQRLAVPRGPPAFSA